MPTFEARVEDLIGTVDDTTGLDEFCKSEAEAIIRVLPEALLKDYASRTFTTTSAGVAVQGKRILSVSRGGYWCVRVDETMRTRVTNSSSLFLATARAPVYYTQVTATDNRLYVKPDPASGAEADIAYITYPTIDADVDSTATGLPTGAEELLVLGVARRVLQKRLTDYIAEEDAEMAQIQQQEIAAIESLYRDRLTALTAVPTGANQKQPEGHLYQ